MRRGTKEMQFAADGLRGNWKRWLARDRNFAVDGAGESWKRWLARTALFMAGVWVLLGGGRQSVVADGGNYASSCNMKGSLSEISDYLRGEYSASGSSAYRGKASVETVYQSIGLMVDNISQSEMNQWYMTRHPDRPVAGTCGLVAMTMLLRKYMEYPAAYRLPKTETKERVFEWMADYAYACGIFTKKDHYGLFPSDQKRLANEYLKRVQDGRYKANLDRYQLWSTTTNTVDRKVRPVTLELVGVVEGKNVRHQVVATGCYRQRVSYQTKNLFGVWVKKTKEFEIVRICNGWTNSEAANWNETTNSFIFFDCVDSLMKLQ